MAVTPGAHVHQSLGDGVPEAAALAFADGLVVVTPAGGVVALDPQGRALWEALQAGCTKEELVEACVAAGAHDRQAAHAAIARIFAAWRGAGIFAHQENNTADRSLAKPINGDQAAVEATYLVGDRPVRIRCGHTALGTLIDAALRPFRVESVDDAVGCIDVAHMEGRFTVYCNSATLSRLRQPTDNIAAARHRCLTALVEAARPSRRLLAILHASAVVGCGKCFLFVGGTGSGKSTLAASLVARGYRFVTDDYAPIEQGSKFVWPVPFAASIKSGSWNRVGQHFPALYRRPVFRHRGLRMRYLEFDGNSRAPIDVGLPIAAILFPRIVHGQPLAARRMTGPATLAAVCKARSLLDTRPELLRETLQVLSSVPAYQLRYGNLDQVAAWLDGLSSVA